MSYTYKECHQKDNKSQEAFETTMSEWLAAEAIGEYCTFVETSEFNQVAITCNREPNFSTSNRVCHLLFFFF